MENDSAAAAIYEGYLDKLPTYSKGSSIGIEEQFKMRYFVLTTDRLFYFKNLESTRNGKAAKGQIFLKDCNVIRESKLEFILQNKKKRI